MNEQSVTSHLQQVIDHVWESKRSSVYRDHWRKHDITKKPTLSRPEDITSLPPITKSDLLAYPDPHDRLYVDMRDVACLTSTSGTTSGSAFFKWRSGYACSYYRVLREFGTYRLLYIWNPHRAMPLVITGIQDCGIEALYLDPHLMKEAEKILASIEIDTITTTPSIATMLPQYVSDKTLLEKITFIDLLGEIPSKTTRELITELFPNAQIFQHFAFQEAGGEALFATPACDDVDYMHVHTENMYVEIVDNLLTFTTLWLPHDMPLIRYQTGDTGVWHSAASCTCERSAPRIRPTGRKDVDFVRTQGFEIRVDEIERILKPFYTDVEPVIHAEISEYRVGERLCAHLHVRLVKKEQSELLESYVLGQITTALGELKLSANMHLRDATAHGLFDQSTVKFETHPKTTEKQKTIRSVG